jgi:hypothetical protein
MNCRGKLRVKDLNSLAENKYSLTIPERWVEAYR